MRLPRILALLVLLAPAAVSAKGLECRDLPVLFRAFEARHYSVKSLDPTLQGRTVERFIKLIDPSKTLLLESDVQKLRADLPQVFETMRRGDCARLDEAWNLALRRAQEDEKIVGAMLGPTYALDESVQVALDPDQRRFPKTAEERAARVRDMVHFQISSYLVSGLKLQAAKEHLIHRYALSTKRLAERRDKGELVELYAEAFAEALDPHTAYMSPDVLADFNIQMRLSLEGIGAVLRWDDGFTVIESLVPGGQADKSKMLRTKDKIIAVAQAGEEPVSTIDMDLSDVVKLIRGKKGTQVTLTILREAGAHSKTFQVAIVRDKIDVSSQAAKITYETRKVGERSVKLGVIDLPSFYGGEDGGRSSYGDMKQLLTEAKQKGVDGIVLDLTRNGGGLLEDAVRISGLFIKRGAVVATKDAGGKVEVLEDKNEGVVYNGPLVVLISPASASASEILAGALKDYHRALIVGGEHTFGKGTVQVVVPLAPEIGAIRVTTGMFFLPGGLSTQQRGVSADVRVPTLFDSADIGEGKLDYALPAQSIPPFLSDAANAGGDERWQPVTQAMIDALASRSKARVAADGGFAKLKQQLADTEKNHGVVRLADLRQRAKDNGKEGDDDDERFKALQAVTTAEGVSILADIASGAGLPQSAAK